MGYTIDDGILVCGYRGAEMVVCFTDVGYQLIITSYYVGCRVFCVRFAWTGEEGRKEEKRSKWCFIVSIVFCRERGTQCTVFSSLLIL